MSVAFVFALLPAGASAHSGPPVAPAGLWRSWSLEPVTLLLVLLSGWLYYRGLRELWRRAGIGRGVKRRQAAAFAAGLASLALALCSPLDALGASLFSAHMAQHLVLMLVSAPLLVLGAPLAPIVWALPLAWRQLLWSDWRRFPAAAVVWHWLNRPLVAWALAALALWVWHLPALYDAALASPWVHALEHACFLGTALLFWWVLLRPSGRRTLSRGAGVLYVFTMGLQSGALGALITFAGAPWYAPHVGRTAAWGLSPLADQQLAGLIMWIPAGVFYLLVAAWLFATWLQAMDATTPGQSTTVEGGRDVAIP